MSRLAAAVGLAPATATHQISALVADGLVSRRREGRHTVVERTERGAGLLELYRVSDLPVRPRPSPPRLSPSRRLTAPPPGARSGARSAAAPAEPVRSR
ncbi:MAG: helix-turn-helix domain-containing protein [Pseudonocardia sp.]|nr:helix-turn-helix domain-containing protein [Pseudonocardia sp.]